MTMNLKPRALEMIRNGCEPMDQAVREGKTWAQIYPLAEQFAKDVYLANQDCIIVAGPHKSAAGCVGILVTEVGDVMGGGRAILVQTMFHNWFAASAFIGRLVSNAELSKLDYAVQVRIC